MASPETVSARIPKDVMRELDDVGRLAGRKRSDLLREVIQDGLQRKRLAVAIERYRNHELTLGAASQMAHLPITQLLDHLKRAGVPFHYTEEDLTEDLAWADEAS